MSIILTIFDGSTLILPAPHFNAELTLRAMSELKTECISGTPSSKFLNLSQNINSNRILPVFVDMIAKQKELLLDLPVTEFSCVGAAICTPKLVRDAKKYLNILNFQSKYGMTETAACGFQSLAGEESEMVTDHVGHLSDHIEAKVIDKDGNTVPFGQPGELCLRGYCTMLGYWNEPAKTAEVIDDTKW